MAKLKKRKSKRVQPIVVDNEHTVDAGPESVIKTELENPAKTKKSPKTFIKNLFKRKKTAIPAVILLALIFLTLVPQTRYLIPGIFIKKKVSFIIQDIASHARISDARIVINDQDFVSDQNGIVIASKILPGSSHITINKLFYKSFSGDISVSLFNNKQFVFNISSTGRPAKVTVKNRLSGHVLSGILVKTEQGSQGKTGEDGTVTLVLPSDKTEVTGTISGDKFVTASINIRAVQDDSTNVFPITPTGSVYFLSKVSGKIDVVKTNLDGTDRQTVLAGTGREEDTNTILVASKDWKYLALLSRRDSDLAKIYLIETATDKVSIIDEGNASFTPAGWLDQTFVYNVYRNGYEYWQAKQFAVKSFNATNRQLKTLDENRSESDSAYDYAVERFGPVYILKDKILYTRYWSASYYYNTRLADKAMQVVVVKTDGSGRQLLHEWTAGYNAYVQSAYHGPDEFYFYVTLDGVQTSYWEYAGGKVTKADDINNETFHKTYPTYLESPNSNNTLWSEARDGKNALFIGDADGKNSKQIATLTELEPYGWYSDDYILVSKNSSELFIMGRDGIKPGDVPTKVSDYHKPDYRYRGYGGY